MTEVEYLLQEIQLSLLNNDCPLSILLVSTIQFFFVRSVLDPAGSSSPCSRSWTGLAPPTDRTRGLPRFRWRAAWTSSSIIAERPSSRKIFYSPLLIASCNTTTMFFFAELFCIFYALALWNRDSLILGQRLTASFSTISFFNVAWHVNNIATCRDFLLRLP